MTKREAMELTRQHDQLRSLGFSYDEAEALHRISMTLRRWFERECGTDNGCIERDETTGKPFWLNATTMRRFPIRDMETGARNRLLAIVNARAARVGQCDITTYVQGDPRGASLYIIRPGDVPAGSDVDSYYSRGLVVC